MKRKRREKTENVIDAPDHLFPTGCTLLNCVLSDNAFRGCRKGTIINVVGDSSAGKSILAFTILAAIAAEPMYKNYRLIHDDAECGEAFNVEKLFGKKLAKRIEAPAYDSNNEEMHSETVQDFHMFVKDAVEAERPFIYILDSWDSVDSEEDQKKIDEDRKLWKKGKKLSGTYGTAKAKQASTILRNIRSDIKKTESLVIIISQVRENLNAMAFGSKKTRSGGKALKHYSWQEIWLFLGKKERKNELQIGVNTIIKVEKNRENGKLRNTQTVIFYDLGIDDVKSNIDWLIANGEIKKQKGKFYIKDLDIAAQKADLIEYIEKNNLEIQLQKIVHRKWNEIEDSVKLHRKARFS